MGGAIDACRREPLRRTPVRPFWHPLILSYSFGAHKGGFLLGKTTRAPPCAFCPCAKMSQLAILRVNPVHRQLADWLIAHGGIKKGWATRAAEHFGYTRAWLSVIYHSDAFQDYYSKLADEHASALAVGLADKVNGLAGQAIDELADRLETQGATLPVSQVIEIAELALKRTALGQQSSPSVQVNVVSPAILAEARKNMREVSSTAPLELKVADPASEKGAS